MKKFNAILDDTTIINFIFFGKLLRRYYVLSILIPLIVASYAAFYYTNQNIVYIKNINFTFKKDDSSSPSEAIASLVGEKSSQLESSDIIAITKSPGFKELLSKNLAEDLKLSEITFSGLKSKDIKLAAQQFATCNENKECIKNLIEKQVSGFFTLIPNDLIDKMMKLQVKTLTPLTSEVILENVQRSLKEFRINQIKHSIIEQKKVSEQLIAEKHRELEELKYEEVAKQMAHDKSTLSSLTKSINNLEALYQRQKINAEIKETQYLQTKKVGSKNTKINKDTIERISQLNSKIKNLKADINALQISQADLNKKDNAIVDQLKTDLKRKEKLLAKLKKSTTMSLLDSKFIETKTQRSKTLEFEYTVTKKQIEKTQSQLTKMQKQKEELITRIEKNENILAKGKPTAEYIRLLSNKLMQLKILESTVISDLVFDTKPSPTRAYRRTTKFKVAIFSAFITFFALFFAIIIRYMFDPRIYDEYELQKTFEDLNVIGKTPDFNN
jgi:hypothetical protein